MSDENYGKEGTAKPAKRKAKETKSIKVCRSDGVAALSSVTCHVKGALLIIAESKTVGVATVLQTTPHGGPHGTQVPEEHADA